MSHPKNILIVGGTGRLGGFIIDAILEKNDDVHIRIMGRNKDEQLIQSSKGRLSFVEGDLTDPNCELTEAVKGVDTVISAIIGDAKLTVDGQKRLIDAAKQGGVKQFIPSAFSVDYRGAGEGWNIPLGENLEWAGNPTQQKTFEVCEARI